MRFRTLIALVLCAVVLGVGLDADAGRRRRRDTEETPSLIQQAMALAVDDRLEALALLEGYLVEGADPELIHLAALHAGEQRRLMGDHETAALHFQFLRREHPGVEPAIIGLALVHAEQGQAGNVLASLELVGDEGVPNTMNADRYRVLALAAVAEGRPPEEQRELAGRALGYTGDDPGVTARVRLDLGALLPSDLPGGEGLVPPDAEGVDRARRALAADNFEEALRLATAVEERYPDSVHVVEARWVRLRAEAEDPFSPHKLGVLLPLTGTYGPAGTQLRETLELATRHSGADIDLVFRDTAGTAETALEQFRDLVLTEGVAGVIGPLLKEVALPIAAEAQAAQVPLVALSQVGGLTETGRWVFRGALTIEQQVRALVDHAMGPMALQTFVVLAPDNSYGHSAHDAFTHLVTERGGEVLRAVFYDPEATDYREAAAELGVKDYDSPERKEELYSLRRRAEARGIDPHKVVLPPLMDFEAIFVPDNARRVPIVASSLAYEEFSIGGFSPRQSHEPAPLLGLNGWHHPNVPVQGGQYVRHAVFVDAFDSEDPEREVYVSEFETEIGRKPGVLESLVYDVGRLVAAASIEAPADRAAFRQQLSDATLETSVTGGTGFGATRELERELLVFRIGEEGIERVSEDEEPEFLESPD